MHKPKVHTFVQKFSRWQPGVVADGIVDGTVCQETSQTAKFGVWSEVMDEDEKQNKMIIV